MSLGPNDLERCGTAGARKRHAALAQLCEICNPGDADVVRPGICPVCKVRITVFGDRYSDHDTQIVTRNGIEEAPCPGSGTEARAANTLAAAVRRRRKELGLTQAQVTARTGIPQPTLASFEAGASGGRVPTLLALSRGLQADVVLVPWGAA